MKQTYFSIPSTSTNGSESKAVTSDFPIPKMPKESKLLKMFDTLGVAINSLRTRIDNTLLEDQQRRWMSDSQNSLREFYKTNGIPMPASLSKNLKELKEELIVEVQEMLNIFESMEQKVDGEIFNRKYLQNEIDRLLEVYLTSKIQDCALLSVEKKKNELLKDELAKSLSDSKDIQANLLKRIKILENYFQRSQAQSVESPNSVRRQKSKDTKSKNRVLKNTNAKISTAHVRKMSRSVSIDSNKCETMNLTLCHVNRSALNTKNVTAVNDGSNIVYVSCGKDVFVLSHEKCVAYYALSRNSNVERALFTTPVIQLVLWIVDSGCSKHMTSNLQLLRNFIEKFMRTIHFGNDHFAAITGYGDYVQNLEGDDLLTGSCDSNLYTIFISEMVASSP
ncbi:hypothetical protein Tco_0186151, partial [Tanacetum coccineum]